MSLRRTCVRLKVSPLAQAVKHIALRGKQGFEATALEDEVAMYRAGSLPVDYRPPRDTAWDDTIERWTYGWQFPLPDVPGESENRQRAREGDVKRLTDLADRLLQAPPSALPRSAESSTEWPLVDTSVRDPALGGGAFRQLTSGGDAPAAGATGSPDPELDDLAQELGLSDTNRAAAGGAPQQPAAPASSPSVAEPASETPKAIIPAEDYAKRHGLPAAYVDDRSERAQACKELGLIVSDLGLPFDPEGLADAVSSVSHRGDTKQARALLDFALQVGFPATPDLFGAVQHGFAKQGDFSAVMVLVDEMKERGVTPARRNWLHLMNALTTAHQPAGALQVADNMRALANIEPDERVFAEHLRALANDDRPTAPFEAVNVFEQMQDTYGLIPMRVHYNLLLAALARSADDQHVQRMDDMARRMETLGLPWDRRTYAAMLHGAARRGHVAEVERLCAKMRDEGVPMEPTHYAAAIAAQRRSISARRVDYAAMKDRGESPLGMWQDRNATAHGIFELAARAFKQRYGDSGPPEDELHATPPSLAGPLNALLQVKVDVLRLGIELLPEDDASAAGLVRFEREATAIWESWYEKHGVSRNVYSYEAYISVLCAMGRIDEAESLFQELAEDRNQTPTPNTYRAIAVAHLASAEEGATGRAIEFLEAMEAVGHPISRQTMSALVKAADDAAYKRDMRRRARRIVEARAEYNARKEAERAAAEDLAQRGAAASPGTGNELSTFGGQPAPADEGWKAKTEKTEHSVAVLDPKAAEESKYAWWENWRRNSISKHELFETEAADGTPRGESFAEKNEALAKMGIQSSIKTLDDVPGRRNDTLLNRIRGDGSEPAGALFALTPDEAAYPNTALGPQSWGATFWRERQIVKKAIDAAKDGHGELPPLSTAGNAVRPVADQLEIERSKATTPGELQDARDMPEHRYDDGSVKPASEFAAPVPVTQQLVWRAEAADPLSPYRTEEDTTAALLGPESETMRALQNDAEARMRGIMAAIKGKNDPVTSVPVPEGGQSRKHAYLEHFRDLYRQGSLEAPDEPVVRFGRSEEDTKAAMAAQVRGWFAAQRQTPASDLRATAAESDEDEARETRIARRAVRNRSNPNGKRRKGSKGPQPQQGGDTDA